MTSYIRAGAEGRDAAHQTNTRYRLRQVVDIRFRRAPNPGTSNSFELLGECGHILDVHRWVGLRQSDIKQHRQIHIGARRKRCRQCPILPTQRT